MPKHQQRARKTPYARPEPQQNRQGIFSRIKQFFWGPEVATELGAPQVITDSSRKSNISAEERYADQRYGDNSRISQYSADLSEVPHAASNSPKGQPGLTSSPNESDVAASSGPNEALRRFFEEKGDEDLSNMEVVGVLSLISQAVSCNESLVDFSNLSEVTNTLSNNTIMGNEPTEASILRGLHVPPSPRPYLRGTPPPNRDYHSRSSLANTSKSPWTSPRPSRISARHSIGYGYGKITPRPQRPAAPRPLSREHSAQPPKLKQVERQSSKTTAGKDVTPAASAILRALDGAPSKRVLTSDTKPSTSTPSKQPQTSHSIPEIIPSASLVSTDSSKTEPSNGNSQPEAQPDKDSLASESSKHKSTVSPNIFGHKESESSVQGKQTALSAQPAAQPAVQPAQTVNSNQPLSFGKPFSTTSTAEKSSPNNATESNGTQDSVKDTFEFIIPEGHTPRQMTPAEEKIVAQSQSEFTF